MQTVLLLALLMAVTAFATARWISVQRVEQLQPDVTVGNAGGAHALCGTTPQFAPPRLMQAFILSSKPDRYRSSLSAINSAFPSLFNVSMHPLVPLSDPRVLWRHRRDTWAALPNTKSRPLLWHYFPEPPPVATAQLKEISTRLVRQYMTTWL